MASLDDEVGREREGRGEGIEQTTVISAYQNRLHVADLDTFFAPVTAVYLICIYRA